MKSTILRPGSVQSIRQSSLKILGAGRSVASSAYCCSTGAMSPAAHRRGPRDECDAGGHQLFVERAGVVLRKDRQARLREDGSLVDLVVQQEGRHARLPLAVDDRPVDRRGAPVLRQQRGVEVEGSQSRHGPHDLGQHAERDDDTQVGPQRPQRPDELRGLQPFGLQDRKPQLPGGGLHVAFAELPPASGGFVGGGDDAHDVVAPGDQRAERRHGEFGRAHEYDAELPCVHDAVSFLSRRSGRPRRMPRFRGPVVRYFFSSPSV